MTSDNWIRNIDDQEAYKELYRFYFKKFYNYGKKFTTNNPLIEDTIQEVFLDIWSNRQKLLNVKSINSYFFSSFRYTLFRNIKHELKISGREEFEKANLTSLPCQLIFNPPCFRPLFMMM